MDVQTRAQYAAQIIENPVFKEAFDILRTAYTDMLLNTEQDDLSTREMFYTRIRLLDNVKDTLTGCVETGRIEKIRDQKIQAQKETD